MVSDDMREEIGRELNQTMEDVRQLNVSTTFEFFFQSEGGQVQGGGRVWLSGPARDGIIVVAFVVFVTAAGIFLYVWMRRSKFSYIFLKRFCLYWLACWKCFPYQEDRWILMRMYSLLRLALENKLACSNLILALYIYICSWKCQYKDCHTI